MILMSTYFQWISVPIADFLGTEFLSQSPGVYCLLTHVTKFLTQRLQQFTLSPNQWETYSLLPHFLDTIITDFILLHTY